ncbi:MAG TPA: PRC-barrel domain-containing protein [Gaiellaceae bacterium]|nr:PRC-barrel domain-containing protein [Gaiellaceae bacterium]
MAERDAGCGSPIAYLALGRGTDVYTAERARIGTVDEVLFVESEDVFEGIVVATAGGRRFVESGRIDRIYERCVLTTLTADEARSLPEPEGGPPVFAADPASGSGRSLGAWLTRLFGGGGGWKRG